MMYHIRNTKDRDFWWCSEEGWTDHNNADAISDDDVYFFDLPMEGEWVPSPIWCASVYMVDKAYGGPEEGGWWYTTYSPMLQADLPLPFYTLDKQEAEAKRDDMQKLCDELNKGRRDISSVLSEGQYIAAVEAGSPRHSPVSRPHYE